MTVAAGVRFIGVPEVARRLNMSRDGVVSLIEKGRFPSAFRAEDSPRSPWRVLETDVDGFIAARQAAAKVERERRSQM